MAKLKLQWSSGSNISFRGSDEIEIDLPHFWDELSESSKDVWLWETWAEGYLHDLVDFSFELEDE